MKIEKIYETDCLLGLHEITADKIDATIERAARINNVTIDVIKTRLETEAVTCGTGLYGEPVKIVGEKLYNINLNQSTKNIAMQEKNKKNTIIYDEI